jgi:hypothetical protein
MDQGLLSLQIVRDDILGILFRWHEFDGSKGEHPLYPHNVLLALDARIWGRIGMSMLVRSGHVCRLTNGSLRLTEKGLVEASAIVRSHRLWEAYLAKHLALPLDHLHAPSERTEHFIGRAIARQIETELQSDEDPHGRSIPKG